MTDKWTRPEYIELSPAEIEWYMQRGRQLRSQAAFELTSGLVSYIRRIFSSVISARCLPESGRADEHRVHV